MTQQEKINLLNKYNNEVAAILGVPALVLTPNMDWNARRTHGQCVKRRDSNLIVIKISKSLINDQDIKEVILHELCHAYAPYDSHHGPAWQLLAKQVGRAYGINITRCSYRDHGDNGEIATLTCPICHTTTKLYKRTNAYYHPTRFFCKHCGIDKTLGKLVFNKIK